MKWSEIRVHTTNEAIEPVSNILNEAGANGVVIEDPLDLIKDRNNFFGEFYELNPEEYPKIGVFVKAYLPTDSALNKQVEKIKKGITNLSTYGFDIGTNQVSLSKVKEEDWSTAWKKYYKPVRISKRVTIVPTWENYTPTSSDELIIELDPGMAFGTGTHPTTVLSIQGLEKHVNKGDIVLDVGCGSGVLSIASALFGAKEVHAFDLVKVAVSSTKINATLNKLDNNISVRQNNLLRDVNIKSDIIVSNILAEIIIQFITDAWNNLKDNGFFITSGIIQSKQEIVKQELEKQGFQILKINNMENWISIIAKKVDLKQ